MPQSSPYSIALAQAERAELEAGARRYTSPYSEVARARIVLYAADGLGNDEIAARLDTPRQVVSKWRKRFYDERLAGLTDLPRGGRPPSFPPDVVVAIKALACELPAKADKPRPLARWQCPDLARAAVEQGIAASISGTTIWRWLSAGAIRPWQHRSWIFPRDPDFGAKAARVLDLYARRYHDTPLRTDEHVISAGEKTSIQARIRQHATTPPAPSQPARVDAEYVRGGSLAYLAAWDVHRAKVFGRCEETAGVEPFDRLVGQVMTCETYASARRGDGMRFVKSWNNDPHFGVTHIDPTRHTTCQPSGRANAAKWMAIPTSGPHSSAITVRVASGSGSSSNNVDATVAPTQPSEYARCSAAATAAVPVSVSMAMATAAAVNQASNPPLAW